MSIAIAQKEPATGERTAVASATRIGKQITANGRGPTTAMGSKGWGARHDMILLSREGSNERGI